MKIIGCRFHLTQTLVITNYYIITYYYILYSIYYIHNYIIGLSIEYKDANSEIGHWLKWIFDLPLLNAEEVSVSFIEDFMSVVPDDARLKKFCDYLCDNYIDETSKFNPKIWASSSISSERTTNSCESFHSKLNTQFTKAHPNIFLFSHVLNLKIQTDSYIIIRSLNNNKISKNKNYEKKKIYIANIFDDYINKKIDRFTYIKLASNHYLKK